jgi:GABA permease
LTRPAFGAALACLLAGVGIGLAWRGSRGSLPHKTAIAAGGDGRYCVLVVANETVRGEALLGEIANRCKGRDAEVLVVTPALPSRQLDQWTGEIDAAIERARQRNELSIQAIQELGLKAKGEVGDSDPNVAIEDALREFPASEVIISTHPPERSHWLERGVVDRARREIDLPVTHVVVDLEAEGQAPEPVAATA